MPVDMVREVMALERELAARGLSVFRVAKRGKALLIVSGDEDDPDVHARLTHVSGREWRVDVRHHSGRWEQTPFVGGLGDSIETLRSIGRLDPRDA